MSGKQREKGLGAHVTFKGARPVIQLPSAVPQLLKALLPSEQCQLVLPSLLKSKLQQIS